MRITFPTIEHAHAAGFTMRDLRYDDGLYNFEGGYVLLRDMTN